MLDSVCDLTGQVRGVYEEGPQPMRTPSIQALIDEIRHEFKQGRPYSCTFTPGIGDPKVAEKDLKNQFELWWGSWIAPKLDQIEAKLPKKKVKA